jgi:5-methylcytosine-specific restriction endonuclease McrA
MRPPEGDRLDDAVDMWHSDSWDCPGGKPQVSVEQLAHGLVVLERWFRDEFNPRKPVTVPKEYRKPRPKAVRVAGELSSSKIPALIRRDVLKRDEFQCQRCGRSIYGIRAAIQHRRPRQMGGSNLLHTMANLVLLCGFTEDPGTCTRWVEIEHREAAYAEGWLVPMGYAPEEWRVRRFGKRWEQPGDIWVPAKPHPDQADDESQGVA